MPKIRPGSDWLSPKSNEPYVLSFGAGNSGPNSSPKQDEKDWFLHGRDPAYQYASKRMDVHKEAITIAVLNGSGKLVMESIIETKAITILEDQKLGRIGPSLDHQS